MPAARNRFDRGRVMGTVETHLLFVVTGALAGLLAGLFGIGGGLVMVPALLSCFALAGMPGAAIPALALGTSLTVIGLTSALASREHLRIGNLRQPFASPMRAWLVLLITGVAAGSLLATRLPRPLVLLAISLFQIAVATSMLRGSFRTTAPAATLLSDRVAQSQLGVRPTGAFLLLTGTVSSIGGIGGATLLIPYFCRRGIDYPRAAALSTFFGSAIGAAGFVSYGLMAEPVAPIPRAIGYVSLPAVASLMLGSMLLVRCGARLSRRLPKQLLTRGFCCFLFASGGKLLLPMLLSLFVAV